ncbi:MAG TPA: fatty acid desaturase [Thermoanaerobaculia bacterium]
MSFLEHRSAIWLTHVSSIVMTIAFFALLLQAPFWIAFLPAVVLAHRIGVMTHEYIHGSPFRKYSHCLLVLTSYDALMLMFGILELYRATHLAHHRWLNGPGDSSFDTSRAPAVPRSRFVQGLMALEVVQYVKFYWEALHGLHPYARPRRLLFCFAATCVAIGAWIAIGRADMVWKLMAVTLFTAAVPAALRGAIEHYAEPDRPGFANEYKVLIPLFNLNKHIHHHEQPRLPWYLLEYRTSDPLAWHQYFLYWFRVNVGKELVLMQPMVSGPRPNPLPAMRGDGTETFERIDEKIHAAGRDESSNGFDPIGSEIPTRRRSSVG